MCVRACACMCARVCMRVRAFAIYFDFEYIFLFEGSVASEKNARELPSKYNFDLLPPAPPISMLAFVAEMPATETSVYFSTATSPTHSTPTLSAGARGGRYLLNLVS